MDGEFHYRNNGGQIERAFCIQPIIFPGHDVSINFEAGTVEHEWNCDGEYRVTPWMKYNP